MGKWNIDPESIKDDPVGCYLDKKWRAAKSAMDQRTAGHDLFEKVAHNISLYQEPGMKQKGFTEGSTQAIKRKLRSQTIQRVPDGKIYTQFDKNSIEQAEIEYLFKRKVLTSEYDGKDMMKNLWKTFNMSYDHGFACVRTGFEDDIDGDPRISYTLVPWNDVFPAPDCTAIEEAEWYIIREWVSRSALEQLINCKSGSVKDKTYSEDVVKYLVDTESKSAIDPRSLGMADRQKGVTPIESIEVRTMYKRGEDEFVTYVPSIKAVLRTVKNYDPRKDVPVHFLILEPDYGFPLGISSVMWTLGQQQFADAFQTTAYNTLLLAANPPIMGFGNLTPSKIKMRPHSFWPMGTNPQNKVEPFKVETTTITQYGAILENVSANMQKNLNITDATIASDANVSGYSGTAPGVNMQQRDKTITVNQYQKRVEAFFSEWANHALRSYIASMSGKHELVVDEHTRRRIWDVEAILEAEKSIIDGDKIEVDFDKLQSEMLEFEVRTGSLIESEKETERKALQELIVPVSQMLNAVSEENKGAFEQNIMQMLQRLLELSDIDVSAQTGKRIDDKLLAAAMQATMEQVMQQQQQIQQLMGQGQPQGQPEQPQGQLQGQPEQPRTGQLPQGGNPLPEGSIPPPSPQDAQMPPQMASQPLTGQSASVLQ